MTARRDRLVEIVHRWRGTRVLVLGDVVADELVVGRPHNVAREAPVLVLRHVESRILPGGAANPAANAAALGAAVEVCGVVGDDEMGRRLLETLRRAGMGCDGVFVDPSRPTTTKTRIWAGGAQQTVQQLLLRVDRVEAAPVAPAVTEQMAAYVSRSLRDAAAVMISDYENGVIHPGLIQASLPAALAANKLVAVDSHGDLYRFRGATLFTPNQPEAEAALGQPMSTLADLESGGVHLLDGLQAQAVLITRGQEGMSLFQRAAPPHHLPAAATPAVDPTGAGDTVSAAFTLAAAAGAALVDAAEIANAAASVVVARVGTATATADDLIRALCATIP